MKILDAMQDIYYGRVASPWALDVDDWSIDPNQVKLIIWDKIFDRPDIIQIDPNQGKFIICDRHQI